MKTKKISLRMLSMFGGLLISWAHAGPVTLDSDEIQVLRALVAKSAGAQDQFRKLRRIADSALNERPEPVVIIVSEGRLKSDPQKVVSQAALEDMAKTEALAWTWAVSGEEQYAAKAREFILAWARRNRSDGNPINETKFEPIIEAYDLVRPTFPASERLEIDGWLRDKAKSLWSNPKGQKENWQSHRLKIVGLIAETIGEPQLWKLADDGFKRQIEGNFEASGESLDFKRRDAMHYHLYSIQPLLTLSCVAQRRGEPLFIYRAPNGASLEKAVEFVKPYALGKKEHIEFAKSQVKFDRTRAAAGEKEYKPHPWNPRRSVPVFAEAGCVMLSYNKVAANVEGKEAESFVNWRAVLNTAVRR